jgi:hypothetical protein
VDGHKPALFRGARRKALAKQNITYHNIVY